MSSFISYPIHDFNVPGNKEYIPDLPVDNIVESKRNPGDYVLEEINGVWYMTFFNRGGDGVHIDSDEDGIVVIQVNDTFASRASVDTDPDGTTVLVAEQP